VNGAVLVTGGTGYLGTLAIEALDDAGVAPIVSLDVREPRRPRARVVEVTADLRDVDLEALLRGHDVRAVVHLASIVDPPPGMDPAELHDIEVGGTRRLIGACVATGVEHLTVTSSGAAYGYTARNRDRLLTESDPVPGHPRFAYARHKAEVEALLADARRDHPQLGQLVLRPGTILGPGTDNQITALFRGPVVLGLTDTDVPFVFVHDRDVAQVIVQGVTERRTGVFNLAGEGVLTLRDIAAIEGARFVPLPAGLVRLALTGLHRVGAVRYGPEQVDFLRYRPVLDGSAAREAFPGAITLDTAACYAVYREGRGG
jgi:UDP-glucose 4-epimerase